MKKVMSATKGQFGICKPEIAYKEKR